VDAAVACGVEVMSRVPMGSTTPRDPNVGKPINRDYWAKYEYTTQFEAAERIAERWGISRADADAYGLISQRRSAQAIAEDRFAGQLAPIAVATPGSSGGSDQKVHLFERDETPRPSTLEGLAALKPTGRPDGIHTAGTSSQIADGAAAVLLMSREQAIASGLTPLATIVDACLVGCDPVLMLEGPIPATRKLLADNKLTLGDIDLVGINEAFAAVVLAWQRELRADLTRVNPNGGAIALGHPLGATGAMLLTKAIHELARSDAEHALVTMCCGGGLGTGTLLRRG
jgi:acetyl-CoA C-acetyltransferase